ncbi:MAG: hypothetical protein FWC38_08145, partial [Proteobacteria bacterium]|nr:hypothetical protein [Pseudomonadota bacterium]
GGGGGDIVMRKMPRRNLCFRRNKELVDPISLERTHINPRQYQRNVFPFGEWCGSLLSFQLPERYLETEQQLQRKN